MQINNIKCNDIKRMLNTYFVGVNKVLKETLERKVEYSIITDSMEKGFIILAKNSLDTYHYIITNAGKKYRDE